MTNVLLRLPETIARQLHSRARTAILTKTTHSQLRVIMQSAFERRDAHLVDVELCSCLNLAAALAATPCRHCTATEPSESASKQEIALTSAAKVWCSPAVSFECTQNEPGILDIVRSKLAQHCRLLSTPPTAREPPAGYRPTLKSTGAYSWAHGQCCICARGIQLARKNDLQPPRDLEQVELQI